MGDEADTTQTDKNIEGQPGESSPIKLIYQSTHFITS